MMSTTTKTAPEKAPPEKPPVVATEPEQKVPPRLRSIQWEDVKKLSDNGVIPPEWERKKRDYLETLKDEADACPSSAAALQQSMQVTAARKDSITSADRSSTASASKVDLGGTQFTDTIDYAVRPYLVDPETGEKLPTVVQVVFRVKDWKITKNNDHEHCAMEGFIEMHWHDYRLDSSNFQPPPGVESNDAPATTAESTTSAGGEAVDFNLGLERMKTLPENIWRPEMMASYGTSMQSAEKYEEMPYWYNNNRKVVKERNGKVTMDPKFVFSGDGVNLGQELDRLRAFPFDSVRIDVSVFLTGQRRGETINDIALSFQRPNLPRKLEDNFSGKWQQFQMNCVKHSGDYELFRLSVGEGRMCMNWAAEQPLIKPALIFSIQLKRTPGFYMQKGILPLYLCACFGLVTFLTEPIELTGRLQMLFALFLTSFAIQWVTLERLPRLPFNTVLDDVVLHVVVSLATAGLGQGISYRVGREVAQGELPAEETGSSGRSSSASDLDVDVSRRLNAFDFTLASYVDIATVFIIITYLIAYSLLGRFRKAFREGRVLKGATTGALRPWVAGKDFRNKVIRPGQGSLWTLDLTDELTRLGSFLGMGVLVEPAEF
ncbi:unnamed protein product [Amoebophrya sp. A25]|nr:unnamed protein product [Amoebophrya sp. A25]|eukprot:GSA25T00022485001.1